MSGPFGSSQWMYQSAAGFYDHEIDGSLRMASADSPYLTRAVTHNTKTFTISFWTKRETTDRRMLYGVYSNSANTAVLGFETDNTLSFYDYLSGYRVQVRTNQVFRDNAGWYHIVVAVDTTQATASNRVKMYVNGEQVTSFQTATYPSQNLDLKFGGGGTHAIGTEGTNSRLWYGGYLANWALVAGQQLDPTSFGEFKSGIWKPIDITGLTYGTGGYLLEFDGNANDTSGNGNNWTENNISAYDYVLDSPTNNFGTLNYLSASGTYSQGNTRYYGPSSWYSSPSTISVPTSGKWYAEFYKLTASSSSSVGDRWSDIGLLINTGSLSGISDFDSFCGTTDNGFTYNFSSTQLSSEGNYAVGTVIGMAADIDGDALYIYSNGTLIHTISGINNGGKDMFMGIISYSGSYAQWAVNFGQDSTFAGATTAGGNTDENGYGDFKYAPPSGFVALCSQNMPAPTFDPAADDTPEDYFNAVLYTGDGVGQSITGVGFQPDLTWIKCRSAASSHSVYDVNRGVYKALFTNTADTETTLSGAVTSFTSDGFTLGTEGIVNTSGRTYVAWNWKAGGTPVSNTDGSITSSVSVNQDAGFSIATYTGNATAGATVGHGLGVAPDMVIVKARARSGGSDWPVYHKSIPNSQNGWIRLNLTNAWSSTSILWNNTAPSSSVVTLGSYDYVNDSGTSHVMYSFVEKEGYSKIGSYTGNGSTDGTFIYTGFRPALWLVKSSTASGEPWMLMDNRRDSYNLNDAQLQAQDSRAETNDGNGIDFLSNGIKIRSNIGNWGTNGVTYIYIAFAEQPFKYANAR